MHHMTWHFMNSRKYLLIVIVVILEVRTLALHGLQSTRSRLKKLGTPLETVRYRWNRQSAISFQVHLHFGFGPIFIKIHSAALQSIRVNSIIPYCKITNIHLLFLFAYFFFQHLYITLIILLFRLFEIFVNFSNKDLTKWVRIIFDRTINVSWHIHASIL